MGSSACANQSYIHEEKPLRPANHICTPQAAFHILVYTLIPIPSNLVR